MRALSPIKVLTLAVATVALALNGCGQYAPLDRSTPGVVPPKVIQMVNPDNGPCDDQGNFATSLSVIISSQGLPERVSITHPSGSRCLDEQARKAATQFTFAPATLHGEPVEFVETMDIGFQNL